MGRDLAGARCVERGQDPSCQRVKRVRDRMRPDAATRRAQTPLCAMPYAFVSPSALLASIWITVLSIGGLCSPARTSR